MHEIILRDDLAGGRRDVDAELERLAVGHGDLQRAIAALDVIEKVVEALDQVLAPCGDRLAKYLGVGQREIRRGERIDVLPGEKVDLLLRMLVEPLDIGYRVVQPAGGEEVRLLHVVEQEVLLPILVPEPLVALGGLDDGIGRMSQELEHRGLEQRRVIPP